MCCLFIVVVDNRDLQSQMRNLCDAMYLSAVRLYEKQHHVLRWITHCARRVQQSLSLVVSVEVHAAWSF